MLDPQTLTWDANGLVPAIVQDATTQQVLMLGYMNADALQQSYATGNVTFFSRSKQRLWTKGETSGHFLKLVSIKADCDTDTLLVQANPIGPTCHNGTGTCWAEDNTPHPLAFLAKLEQVIAQRQHADPASSYTAKLFAKGRPRMAQKVGEEGVEVVIEAMKGDKTKLTEEAADLMFHLLVLLRDCDLQLADVVQVLQARHKE